MSVDRWLQMIQAGGFWHLAGWAVIACIAWAVVGYLWEDKSADPWKYVDNDIKVIVGTLVSLIGGGAWPLLLVVVVFAGPIALAGYAVFCAARRLRKAHAARTVKPTSEPITDTYEKQAASEVERILTEDRWMSAFRKKTARRPEIFS